MRELGGRVRQAGPDDAPAVAAFTQETWDERDGDYIPDVFPDWVENDGPAQRTFVAVVDPETVEDVDEDDPEVVDDGVVVGCCQATLLSEWEAWAQGLRVHPAARGRGVTSHLSATLFDWAREQGATVCRNMVFSWNVAGLGQSRSVGFDPCTEFRFARPDPDPDATIPDGFDERARDDVDRSDADRGDAAWALWQRSTARDRLRGLVMDEDESWALSTLTRGRLQATAAEDRLLTIYADDGVAGFATRDRTYERDVADADNAGGSGDADGTDAETETWAIYGIAVWTSVAAARAVYRAIARDAADVGADAVRVLVPESVDAVSDTAAVRVSVADEPDFVMAADLTDPSVCRVDD